VSMTFGAAKAEVARNLGGSAISAQLTIAGQAIVDAIREIDSMNDWEYKLITLADIAITSANDTYVLTNTPPVKNIYSARLKGNKRTLSYVRQREIDRFVRDQEAKDIPQAYTDIQTVGTFSIKLMPFPSLADTLQVRVYAAIKDTYADVDALDIPDSYLPAVLALARYNYLIDRSAEDPRAQTFRAIADDRIQKAILADVGNPDEDVRLLPQDEWKGAASSDITIDALGFDW